MIESCHDDGERPLVVTVRIGAVVIRRADGLDLSATEIAHVRGVLAANRVELI